ncbi:WD40/YVTN/BNR-like repeat-containing protein [Chryseobacterium paridis]|uniref:Glycosyl hydrolase n=1 Tax=Chryseobacterium paridis TaxID=2800328 RepID=A0ABS1FU53_9FLAO|nr:glycosyl hydrolase [Chryseobacterium paridis]MBK1895952.1 glycosyl hydrolase [Chryseobacterium paridis]
MKKILSLLFAFVGLLSFSQQISLETIFNDKISIRAVQIWDHKVWYAGTDSKFGFVDLKDFKNQKQIQLSEGKLEFRTLAQNKNYFYAINVLSPAYFFEIDKKDLKSNIVFKDTVKTAFYDALHFVNDDLAYSFSDSDTNDNLKLAVLKNGKWGLFKNEVILNKGEAAFAASNTNIASTKKYLWIATGGKASRVIRMDFKTGKIEIFNTPFTQGEASQGMYSIDFYDDRFGVAVGGDYTKQADNINNIAITKNGGKTWQIQASGANAGYMTCVKIRPGSNGKEMIAVGDQHISYSADFGKTWKKISDEKNLYVCEWVDRDSVIFAGKDKIALAKLKF